MADHDVSDEELGRVSYEAATAGAQVAGWDDAYPVVRELHIVSARAVRERIVGKLEDQPRLAEVMAAIHGRPTGPCAICKGAKSVPRIYADDPSRPGPDGTRQVIDGTPVPCIACGGGA